jgi:hypothetical protein
MKGTKETNVLTSGQFEPMSPPAPHMGERWFQSWIVRQVSHQGTWRDALKDAAQAAMPELVNVVKTSLLKLDF